MTTLTLGGTEQLWNRRLGVSDFVEPTHTIGSQDPIDEDAREDPNNAIFFESASSGGVPSAPFTAFTLGYTAPSNCASIPNSTVSGAWINAVGNISTQFIYRDGNFLGTPDLRAISGYSNTTREVEGNLSNGTDSKSIPYSNGAGTSYQFRANNTTTEALGVVQWIPNGLCTATIPSIVGLVHDENEFQISASQAQCKSDFISFEITVFALGAGSGISTLTVTLYEAQTGTPRVTIPLAAMHGEGAFPNFVYSFRQVMPPAAYVAIATLDLTGGIGGSDYFDAISFNVPRGECGDTTTDISAILLALSQFNATIDYDILQNVTDHRNGTIELNMTSNFYGLGFDGLIFLFFWIACLLFFSYQEWWFAMAFTLPGLLEVLFPDQIPSDFVNYFMLCLLGVILEISSRRFSWGYYKTRNREA